MVGDKAVEEEDAELPAAAASEEAEVTTVVTDACEAHESAVAAEAVERDDEEEEGEDAEERPAAEVPPAALLPAPDALEDEERPLSAARKEMLKPGQTRLASQATHAAVLPS